MIRINNLDKDKWKRIEEVHYEFYSDEIREHLKESKDMIKKKQKKLKLENNKLINIYIGIIEYILEKDKSFFTTVNGMLDFIEKYKGELDFFSLKKKGKKTYYQIDKVLKLSVQDKKKYGISKIFNYDFMGIKKKGITYRHKIISMMGVRVCPYCQRQYITNYNNNKETTADLDHHYPKSKYPFLALSLYNFIPSCQICNSRMKGNYDTKKSIYPYLDDFDSLGGKFRTSESIVTEILEGGTEFFVEIENCNNNEIIKEAIKVFKLDEVYKVSHNDYIKEMLYNIEKYPVSYLESLTSIFEEGDKENLKYHFEELIKKPYKDRIEKGEPLAKLTKDILEEFKIKI